MFTLRLFVYMFTETVLSPWMAADEARVSHVLPHVVWWKKKKRKKKCAYARFLLDIVSVFSVCECVYDEVCVSQLDWGCLLEMVVAERSKSS